MATVTFKGDPVHTNGNMPEVGSTAPDFILTNSELKDYSLKQFGGKKLILSINPSLDTSVCSIVLKKFNEEAKNLLDVVVVFVSADLPFAQKRMCTQEGLQNIKTLSMLRSKDFAKDYGILLTDGPLAGLTSRACIVLDEKAKVLYCELVKEITNEPDYSKALKACL